MIMEKVLVTGSSGFIGMHLCKNLLDDGYIVEGIDNMNDYYDLSLKEARLNLLSDYDNFNFNKIDISNLQDLEKVFNNFKPEKVVNLAAQAGVRYSIENPHVYIQSNITGFTNIIEACRHYDVSGLIYASSSSVYGGNKKMPFSVDDRVDKPISIYAASKISNELIAHTYSHLYGLNTTGLRFFTVYGPWGRPDMAMYIFTDKIRNGKRIQVFNHGKMQRDFTYIDDIVNGIRASIENNYSFEIFNLGNNRCENLMDMVSYIEEEMGKTADINFMDIQPGDVPKTFADIDHAKNKLNYEPKISIQKGIPKFIEWYKSYYKIR
jgi:UDP-glucuronate 4-epimerase